MTCACGTDFANRPDVAYPCFTQSINVTCKVSVSIWGLFFVTFAPYNFKTLTFWTLLKSGPHTCCLWNHVNVWQTALVRLLSREWSRVIQEVAVVVAACLRSEKFEAPEAPFSPTAAPELCLTLHTKWRLCVTNWFQLAVAMVSTVEGAVGERRGQDDRWVCHMTTHKNVWCHLMHLVLETWWGCIWVDQRRWCSSMTCHWEFTFDPGSPFVPGFFWWI